MAISREDYLNSLYGSGQLPSRGTSMSIGDYAKQTGLGQSLADFQDAYASSVLAGKKSGEDILKQGDKAFSSAWSEILQRALEASSAQRATGGELGTDFSGALSTMLSAMREAGAGATEQQMAYSNLANKVAELMAQSNVQAMGDYKDQAAALAAYYAELMQSDAMLQQNDVNLLAQLLSEQGSYNGNYIPSAPTAAPVVAGATANVNPYTAAQVQSQADADAVTRFEDGRMTSMPRLATRAGEGLLAEKMLPVYQDKNRSDVAGTRTPTSLNKGTTAIEHPLATALSNLWGGTTSAGAQPNSLFSVLNDNIANRRAALTPVVANINPLTGVDSEDDKDKKKRQQAVTSQAALIRQQAAQNAVKQKSVAQALQEAFASSKKAAPKSSTAAAIASLPKNVVGSSSVKGTVSRNSTGATNVGTPGVWFNPGTGGTASTPAATPKPNKYGVVQGPVYTFK